MNEIITDDLNMFENVFYIQLALVPLSFNRCLSMIDLLIGVNYLI